ncbi:MAG: BBP7 family outer membrane beta-barrel protein [Planctomycetes bacterium]|nr:BBP7 family outer membrane beta-barrel protein [Planctomycetota bacterium]
MPFRHSTLLALLVLFCQGVSSGQLLAQSGSNPPMMLPQVAPNMPAEMPVEMFDSNAVSGPMSTNASATSNQLLLQQYQALQTSGTFQGTGQENASGENCSTCSGSGVSGYDRCGCNIELFPWISGPGSSDQWCVGPKWEVDAGGLIMFRDDADWNRVIANVGGATTSIGQFDPGPGGRVFVTGYNDSGFGIQVGYEGINDWNANLAFAPVAGTTQEFTYQSRLNSVEINFLPNVPSVWKLYSGFRYVQLDEDFLDNTRADRVLPAPADPPGTSQTIDQGLNRLLENRLFGLQLGGRRDAWQFGNRLTLQTFANAGVYINRFRREDIDLTVTTTISGDDTATPGVTELTESSSSFSTTTRTNLNDVAFVGEAGISAAWRLTPTTAVRAGYQILALDGVADGLTASFTPGLNSDTLIFHGLQFGLEYRR